MPVRIELGYCRTIVVLWGLFHEQDMFLFLLVCCVRPSVNVGCQHCC